MNIDELKFYWEYFRSLCKRLDNTRNYVDHSIGDDGKLKYGTVCSWEFQQILLLAGAEFENISKQLCIQIDQSGTFNVKYADIKKISKTILSKYPRIGETKIMTCYTTIQPLSEWTIVQNSPCEKEYVAGLSWWDDYDDLKHRTFEVFHKASLQNCVSALASLMVIELYLMKVISEETMLSLNKGCVYFSNIYTGKYLCTPETQLPDFVNVET